MTSEAKRTDTDIESRRSLLKKAAVGAGAVWAAPVLLSTPAAAQLSGIPTIPTPFTTAVSCNCQGNNTQLPVVWPTNSAVGDLIVCVYSCASPSVVPQTPFTTGTATETVTPVAMTTGVNPERYSGTQPLSTFVYYIRRPADTTGVMFNNTALATGKESACLLTVKGVGTPPQGQADSNQGTASPATAGPINSGVNAAVVLAGAVENGNATATGITVSPAPPNTWFELGMITNGAGFGCGASYPDIFIGYGQYPANATITSVSQAYTVNGNPNTETNNVFLISFLA